MPAAGPLFKTTFIYEILVKSWQIAAIERSYITGKK